MPYSSITLSRGASLAFPRFVSSSSGPRPNGNTDQLQERITKLRTENQQLRLHLDLYEEHIRRLTIENDKLGTELGQTAGVTTINPSNLANRRS
jgi:sigma54-dependent transcription regulator